MLYDVYSKGIVLFTNHQHISTLSRKQCLSWYLGSTLCVNTLRSYFCDYKENKSLYGISLNGTK